MIPYIRIILAQGTFLWQSREPDSFVMLTNILLLIPRRLIMVIEIY